MIRLSAFIIFIAATPLLAVLIALLALAYPLMRWSDRRAQKRERRREREEWSMPVARGELLVWGGDLVGVN